MTRLIEDNQREVGGIVVEHWTPERKVLPGFNTYLCHKVSLSKTLKLSIVQYNLIIMLSFGFIESGCVISETMLW